MFVRDYARARRFGDLYFVTGANPTERSGGSCLRDGQRVFTTSTTLADGTAYEVTMTRKPTVEPDESEASTTLAIIVDGLPLGAAEVVVSGSSWTASFRSPNGRHVVVTSSATLPHELQLASYPATTVVPRGPSPLERRGATSTAAYREVRTGSIHRPPWAVPPSPES